MTVSVGMAKLKVKRRCEDGSDESSFSCNLAERGAIKVVGNISRIKPVTSQVALVKGGDAQSLKFSHSSTAPRTVLHLWSRNLALKNIAFLIAHGDLASDKLFIGLPVLRLRKIDTRTLFEQNRASLDETYCAQTTNPPTAEEGYVSRLMSCRLHGVSNLNKDRPRDTYFRTRNRDDPFLDPSLMDPIDDN